jgi:polysaccharide biosynthesis/export protein
MRFQKKLWEATNGSLQLSTLPMIIGVWLAAFMLTGCANSSLPRPPVAELASPEQRPLYRCDIGDVLDLRFPRNSELNEQAVIGLDGRISVQFAHDVVAAGRTLADLTKDLSEAYSKELVDPLVSVSIRSYSGIRIYVAGEVATPGEFVETGPITALQAIARAGGFKISAARSKVILIRRGPKGKPDIYGLDETGLTEGYGKNSTDAELVSYDIVYVPRSAIGDVAYLFAQLQGALPLSFVAVYSIPKP